MGDIFASISGEAIERGRLIVPQGGPWCLEAELTTEKAFSGAVVVKIGATTLRGTVDPGTSGTMGLTRHVRVLGGAGGWSKVLPRTAYANDAGVKASLVVEDIATACGETIGTFAPEEETLGLYWVRSANTASRSLEEAIGAASWWVDFDGVTHVGARANPASGEVEVARYNPTTGSLSLYLDELSAVGVGGTVKAPNLPAAVEVVEYEVTIDSGTLVCLAQTQVPGTKRRTATELLRLIAQRSAPGLFGKYEYRVVQTQGKRLDLQAVRAGAGHPDILRVPQWAGAGGLHTKPKLGSTVLVEFIEGRRSRPIVTGYAPGDDPGHVPDELLLCAGANGAARQGDTVEVLLPPMVFVGQISGNPATGMISAPNMKTLGSITTASAKVKIG